jgi:EpsI family protein
MTEPQNQDPGLSQSEQDRRHYLGLGLLAGVFVSMVAMFAGTFQEMWVRWFPVWKRTHLSLYDRLVEGQSYYTHGPLVPLVSIFIFLLLVRHTKIRIKPSRVLGGVVLGAGLLLHLVSVFARVNFSSAVAMIIMLAGLVLVFWGKAALKRFWFPIAFLLFMVPLPMDTMYKLAFQFKMMASEVGVTIANGLGPVVERGGNHVVIEGGKQLTVANVCNGLRTMISLLAFGALYAYVCKLKGVWRLLIFLLTIPVALVANSLRIVSLILVAHWTNVEFATGWYHDVSGLLVFVAAFFLMFGLERAILWGRAAVGKPASVDPLFHDVRRDPDAEPVSQWSLMGQALGRPRAVVITVILLGVAIGSLVLRREVVPGHFRKDYAAQALSSSLDLAGGRKAEQFGPDIPLDEQTMDILETEDYLNRRFRVFGEPLVHVSIIFSMDNRKGTHPPDVCLAGSGEGIVAKETVGVDGIPGRDSVDFRGLVVNNHDGSKTYYIYTYKCGGRYTDSFWMQQLLIMWNGLVNSNASGALIRLSTPIEQSPAQARERCIDYIRAVIPQLDANLP